MKRDFWGIDGEIWGWNRYIISNFHSLQQRVLKNTPCKIGQMFKRKGGGVKAFWTMFKKTALFLMDGFPNKAYHSNKLKNSHVYSIAAIHDVLLWRHRTIYINWHNTTLCVTWRRGSCEEVGNPCFNWVSLFTLGFIVSLLKLVEQRIICPVEIFTTAPCWLLILRTFIMIMAEFSSINYRALLWFTL